MVVPCAIGVFERAVLVERPFAEEHGGRVLPAEIGGQGLFEAPPKQHGCPGIFLLPALQVAMPVTTWAAQVLTDLGEAIGHGCTSLLFNEEEDDSSIAQIVFVRKRLVEIQYFHTNSK